MLMRTCKRLFAGVLLLTLAGLFPVRAADTLTDTRVQAIPAGTTLYSLTLEHPFRCHGEMPVEALLCGYGIGVVRLHIALQHPAYDRLKVRLAHRQWLQTPPDAHPRAEEWCNRYAAADEVVVSDPLPLPSGGTGYIDMQNFAAQSPRGEWLLIVEAPHAGGWVQGWGIEIGYRFDATNPNFPRPGAGDWCIAGVDTPADPANWSRMPSGNRMTLWFDYEDGPLRQQHSLDVIAGQAELFHLLDILYFGAPQEYPARLAGTLFEPPKHPVEVFVSGGGGQSRGGGRWLRVSGKGTRANAVVAAHEFGHRVCRGYGNNRPAWYNEGMAVTMETVVQQPPEQRAKSSVVRFGPRSLIPGLYDGAYRNSAFWGYLATTRRLYTDRQRHAAGLAGAAALLEPLPAAPFFVDMLEGIRMHPKTDKRLVLRDIVASPTFGDMFCGYVDYQQTAAPGLHEQDRRSLMEYAAVAAPVDGDFVSADFGFNAGILPLGSGRACMVVRCGHDGSITANSAEICVREGIFGTCIAAETPLAIRGDASVYRVDMGPALSSWRTSNAIDGKVVWSSLAPGIPRATRREDRVCRRDHVTYVAGSRLLVVTRTAAGSIALETRSGTPHSLLGWQGSYGLNRNNTLGALMMVEIAAEAADIPMAIYADGQPMLYTLLSMDAGPAPMGSVRFGAVRPYGAATHRFVVPRGARKLGVRLVNTAAAPEGQPVALRLSVVLDYGERGRQSVTGTRCFPAVSVPDTALSDGAENPVAVEVTVLGIPGDTDVNTDRWLPYGVAVAFDDYGNLME